MNKPPATDNSDLDELRRLLVGPNINKLEQLAEKLDSPQKLSSEIAHILPQAMRISSAEQGDKLSEAMIPTVEEIVRLSIQRDINKFANALFPVIGPAIRKSIAETFRQMMQSLNQVLEYGLSWQGLKWRLESIRTGIPFAQIVLLNSLEYRVEQVFLIHRHTGLLLNHVEMLEQHNQNADMVSSMLSAIGDFVGDSFDVNNRQALDSIRVGDFSIWIEQGPDAVLAVAIRGDAPASLRDHLQQTLEEIQSQFETELTNFKSDTAPFEACRSLLQSCMQSGYITKQEKGSSLKINLIVLLLAILLAFWLINKVYLSIQQQDYVDLLEQEPGYVITDVVHDGSQISIKGLRDPLARAPQNFIALSTLDPQDVSLQFEPYYSLQRPFVQKRLHQILKPPRNVILELKGSLLVMSGFASDQRVSALRMMAPLIVGIDEVDSSALTSHIDLSSMQAPGSVKLSLDSDNGHLSVSGRAPQAWIEQARAKALSIPGIFSYDDAQLESEFDLSVFHAPDEVTLRLNQGTLSVAGRAGNDWIRFLKSSISAYPEIQQLDSSQLVNLDRENLQLYIQQLEKEMIFFDVAATNNYDASDLFNRIAMLIKKIIEVAEQLSQPLQIIIHGHSDSIGDFQNNVFLSLERANYVAQYLINNGINPAYIKIKGLEAPVEKEKTSAEQRYNRRVTFTVLPGESSPDQGL